MNEQNCESKKTREHYVKLLEDFYQQHKLSSDGNENIIKSVFFIGMLARRLSYEMKKQGKNSYHILNSDKVRPNKILYFKKFLFEKSKHYDIFNYPIISALFECIEKYFGTLDDIYSNYDILSNAFMRGVCLWDVFNASLKKQNETEVCNNEVEYHEENQENEEHEENKLQQSQLSFF